MVGHDYMTGLVSGMSDLVPKCVRLVQIGIRGFSDQISVDFGSRAEKMSYLFGEYI